MSNVIQLEHQACPKCNLSVSAWTVKAEVVNGTLGVQCPSCRELIKLVVKGGEETAAEAAEAVVESTVSNP